MKLICTTLLAIGIVFGAASAKANSMPGYNCKEVVEMIKGNLALVKQTHLWQMEGLDIPEDFENERRMNLEEAARWATIYQVLCE